MITALKIFHCIKYILFKNYMFKYKYNVNYLMLNHDAFMQSSCVQNHLKYFRTKVNITAHNYHVNGFLYIRIFSLSTQTITTTIHHIANLPHNTKLFATTTYHWGHLSQQIHQSSWSFPYESLSIKDLLIINSCMYHVKDRKKE